MTKKTTNQGTPINWHDHVFSGGKFLRENLCYVTDSASQHHSVPPGPVVLVSGGLVRNADS